MESHVLNKKQQMILTEQEQPAVAATELALSSLIISDCISSTSYDAHKPVKKPLKHHCESLIDVIKAAGATGGGTAAAASDVILEICADSTTNGPQATPAPMGAAAAAGGGGGDSNAAACGAAGDGPSTGGYDVMVDICDSMLRMHWLKLPEGGAYEVQVRRWGPEVITA
jgi:hypothetical protein